MKIKERFGLMFVGSFLATCLCVLGEWWLIIRLALSQGVILHPDNTFIHTIVILVVLSILFTTKMIMLSSLLLRIKTLVANIYRVRDGKEIRPIRDDDMHDANQVLMQVKQQLDESRSMDERLRDYLKTHDKLAMIGLQTSSVVHEINGNLLSANGYISLWQPQNEMEEQWKLAVLESLELATKRIKSALSTMQLRNREIGVLDLRDVLDKTVDTIRIMMDETGTRLVYDRPEEPCEVVTTYSDVYVSVMQALINAYEAIDHNHGQIDLRIARTNAEWCIVIQDNGHGIDPDHLEHIGKAFWTTKPNGHGMGVFSIKSTLQRYGGTLNIESDGEKGTTVSLCLPRRIV